MCEHQPGFYQLVRDDNYPGNYQAVPWNLLTWRNKELHQVSLEPDGSYRAEAEAGEVVLTM